MKKMRVATIKNNEKENYIQHCRNQGSEDGIQAYLCAFNESAQRDRQLVTRSTSTRLTLARHRENMIYVSES
jgi:hypothetical protein